MQSVACLACGTVNPAGQRFCGQCGAALAIVCPVCGQANPAGNRFCGNCGAGLGAHAAQTRASEQKQRRLATILFADLVGSTSPGEALDPEEVDRLIGTIQAALAAIVTRYEARHLPPARRAPGRRTGRAGARMTARETMRLGAALTIFTLATLLPARVQAASPAPAAGTTLAHVRAIIRGLSVQPPHKRAHRGKRADPLYQQYALETKRSERASVSFKDSTILYLNQLTFAVLRNPNTTVVKGGEIDEVHPPGTNHTIITASATAAAVGTNFDVRVKGKRSIFIVVSGSLLVKNKKGQVTVTKDQETTVVTNKPPTPPAPVDAEAAIGWTVSISSGGWQALKTPAAFAPEGVATDTAGNIYATDFSVDQVVKYSPAGKLLLAWGSKGNGPGQLDAPHGITVDSAGNVYVADFGNARVEKFSPTGQFESQIGDTGVDGSNPGQFFGPDALAVDSHDNLYVADQGNDRIQTFSPSGQPLLQIGGLGSPPDLSEPQGVAVDSAGNIYVADTLNNRAVKLAPDGTLQTVYGTKGNGLGQLDTPEGVAVDGAGNVFVADTLNGRIQEFANNGEFLTSWGMTGDGVGQFDQPNDTFVDRAGTLYESESHRIQRLAGGAIGTG